MGQKEKVNKKLTKRKLSRFNQIKTKIKNHFELIVFIVTNKFLSKSNLFRQKIKSIKFIIPINFKR